MHSYNDFPVYQISLKTDVHKDVISLGYVYSKKKLNFLTPVIVLHY